MNIDLSKFKTFNFKEGVPYMSITCSGITFNKAVIMKLGYPSFVQLLINEEDKQLLLKPCKEDDQNSVSFYKEKMSKVISVRWNVKDLIQSLERLMNIDLKMMGYRINGELLKNPDMMLFDLNSSMPLD